MNAQVWPLEESNRNFLFAGLAVSILLHGIFFGSTLVFPLLFEKEKIIVPVVEVVRLDKPQIRVRRPKSLPKSKETKPAPKPDAPKFTRTPKPAITPQKETEIREIPDTNIQKTVREYVKEMMPKMVMKEEGDPRLSFWIKRVHKKFQTHWNPPGGIAIGSSAELSIIFTATRQGNIINPLLDNSSGNSMLDGFALDVVERVGSLPPIPPNYNEKDELSVKVILPYTGH